MNNSALRTLEILEFLSTSKSAKGITEISRALEIPKSSVFDIIYTLLEKGYVEIDNDQMKTFKLGLSTFQLGSKYINNINLYKVAHPILEQLKNDVGETVYLAIENKGKIIYLDKVESDTPILSTCSIGSANLMHLTGLGKAILAGYPEDRVEEITGGGKLEVRTKNTIPDHETLIRHLQKVREEGIAFDNREDTDLVFCIAAPIFDSTNTVVAAISVSMLYSKLTDDRKIKISKKVTDSALTISRKLGYFKDSLYQ